MGRKATRRKRKQGKDVPEKKSVHYRAGAAAAKNRKKKEAGEGPGLVGGF